jgi:hypothetical protein
MVVSLSANKLCRVKLATDNGISAEPVITFSRSIAGHVSVDAIRALLIFKPVPSPDRGVHVIDDFPPFICDSCEYVKTTRKQIRKEAAQ